MIGFESPWLQAYGHWMLIALHALLAIIASWHAL